MSSKSHPSPNRQSVVSKAAASKSAKCRDAGQSSNTDGKTESLLREVRSLQKLRTHRDSTGSYYAEGVRNFLQAVETPELISQLIYSEKLLVVPLARQHLRRLRREGIPTLKVSADQFRYSSFDKRVSGIGMILKQRWKSLSEIRPDDQLGWTLLGDVQSAGNFGTLIRTSEAVGAAGFVLIECSADPYDPGTVRASMGACFHQHYVRCGLTELTAWVQAHSAMVVGASPEATHSFHEYPFTPKTLLMLGSERHGLSDHQRLLCHDMVTIPMQGRADSLNLGVAGSLMLYEKSRHCQRSNT